MTAAEAVNSVGGDDKPAPRVVGEAIPVTVLTGFLGSGKTTVLNHLLQNASGVRIAVLVNDFGEINIDQKLIEESKGAAVDTGVVELSNGCICCTMSADVRCTIERVIKMSGPVDHLIIETSGVSDPYALSEVLELPDIRSLVWLAGIVSVVDAEAVHEQASASASARAQLQIADVVVLNKCDLLDEGNNEMVEAVQASVKALAPQAVVVPCMRGKVRLEAIVDSSGARGTPRALAAPGGYSKAAAAVKTCDGGAGCDDAEHDHTHTHTGAGGGGHLEDDGIHSFSYRGRGYFDLARLQDFMMGLPEGLLRAKGFVWIAGRRGRRTTVQLSGHHRFNFVESEPPTPPGADPESELVIIGRGLDQVALRLAVERCVVQRVSPRAAATLGVSEPSPPVGEGGEQGAPGAGAGLAARAARLRELVAADDRFDLMDAPADAPGHVIFKLVGSEWHGIDGDRLNVSLVTRINAGGAAFLVNVVEGGAVCVAHDVSMLPDVDAVDGLWRTVQDATVATLSKVFFAYFCCSFR